MKKISEGIKGFYSFYRINLQMFIRYLFWRGDLLMGKNPLNRQVDLDWIRVIATLIVFLYHISMFFNPFPWHVKNGAINDSYILIFSLLVGTWIMPIFFAISGITTYHALQRRIGKEFVKERLVRLGIPLVFGVLVLTPPQVYIERITHQQFEGSFLSFFPHFFNGLYLEINGTGNFAFFGLHLWYLLVLLVFSLTLLPVFGKVKASKKFNFKRYLWLSFILLIVAAYLEIVNLGGWGIPFYLIIYCIGYIYFSQDPFKEFIRKNKLIIGVITFISSSLYIIGFMNGMAEKEGIVSLVFTYIKVLNSWNWLLFIFYLGDKYFVNRKNGLKYLSQASMPFYILHQPIIVGIGFYLIKLSWNTPSKILLLILGSFFIIMLIYQFAIKPISVLRILFGIKGKSKKGNKNSTISVSGK
jgi:glucans biosynthesis protein C